MKILYNRYWGRFSTDAIPYFGCGYSGHPDYLNDPTKDYLVGQGPIPAGSYTITKIIPNDPHTGLISCMLEPANTNDMKGRSGFRIHGDNPKGVHSASDGCIIAPRDVRSKFSLGDVIEVV